MTARWREIPSLTAPGYKDKTLNDVQKSVNWYGEGDMLVAYPGLELLTTVANNAACRGAFYASDGFLYSVHGNTLYILDPSTNIASAAGTISTSTGAVYFAENNASPRDILIVAAGSNGYIYDGSLTLISDVNFPTPGSADFMNNVFVVNKSGTNQFYHSQISDGADWTPVAFASAEASSDAVRGVIRSGSQIYVFGDKTIEPWYNTNNTSFAFEPISGGVINIGVLDFATVRKSGNSIVFVGSGEDIRFGVYKLDGASIGKVSTPYIDSRIGAWAFSGTFTVWASSYGFEGHEFYELTNSVTGETFLYDLTMNRWDMLSSGSPAYHRTRFIVNDVSTNHKYPYALDAVNGKIYKVSPNYNSEDGTAITRTRDFKVDFGMSRTFHSGMRLEFEVDHDSSASYTFSCTLSWSDDNGLSFNTPITLSKAVTSGTTGQQIVLSSPPLGSPMRGRIYRLVLAGPAARILLRRGEILVDQGRF